MDPVGQPSANGGLAGPGSFAHILQQNRILAGITTANDTEGEISDSLILLIIASKKPVGIVNKAMPLSPVRTRSLVLPA